MKALQNANNNLDNLKTIPILLPLVKEQLNNAATLLEKGYGIWDKIDPLLEKYGDVDNVPEKEVSIVNIPTEEQVLQTIFNCVFIRGIELEEYKHQFSNKQSGLYDALIKLFNNNE